MKKRFNFVLIIILTLLVGALGFFSYKFFFSNDKVLVPDFTNKQINEVNTWCNSLEKNPCTISYDNSDDVENDYVIYQSISANEELGDSISFIISLGKKVSIKLPTIDKNTNKDVIESWAKQNNLTNVNYFVEASSTVDKGGIIRIVPNEIIALDTPINVYISSGKKETENKAIEVESGKYINLTIEEFEAKAKELGLKPVHAQEKDNTSSTVKKGNVVWHGSGTYEKNENIRYGICKGESAITVVKGTMVGLTLDEFKSKIATLGNKGLKAKHNADYDDYSSTIAEGLIVWHGSGDYEEEEEISYGLSKGEDKNKIIVSYGSYIARSVDEFNNAVKALGTKGLKPNHKTEKDEYSETVAKGNIVWHGSGEYENEETINYGVSLGKENDVEESEEIVVKQGTYVGKTLADFKSAVEKLGLVAYHREEWDIRDSTKSSNTICRNGYGTYEKGEKISYGLYIGSESEDIVVTKGQYVGKTLDEFKKICNDLGLIPEHSEVYSDDPSDTIAKGCLDYHGYGTYVKGEVIHYTLSLGKKEDAPKVNVISYAGKTESEFKTYLANNNLKVGSKTSEYSNTIASGLIISNDTGSIYEGASINYKISLGKDTRINVVNYSGKAESELSSFIANNGLIANRSEENSSSIEAGKIISNSTGLFEKGATITYKVSLGKAKYSIMDVDSYNSIYQDCTSYDAMVSKLRNNAFSKFNNVTYAKGNSHELSSGKIISIKVGNTTSYNSGDYDFDIPIVITIQE